MDIHIRSEGEIIETIDRLCLASWGAAEGGASSDPSYSQLTMLLWVLGIPEVTYEDVYSRGKKVYKEGWKFEWDNHTRTYKKVLR